MTGPIIERTISAMICEIERSPWAGIPAKTIFFGGGTPTFVSAGQLLSVFSAVIAAHPPLPDAEITSEANPGTVDSEKFAAMKQAGFNRISLGAQSFEPDDLLRLDRIHSPSDVETAVKSARLAGFENINIDLMFGLEGQSLQGWNRNLRRAIELGTDHLSLYGLTLEPNTKFYKRHLSGQLVLPDEDIQVAMYDMAVEETAKAGMTQYEISNFSRSGMECQHNLCYWRSEPYAGYGPGAVGCMDGANTDQKTFLGGVRTTNIKHPDRYCEAIESGAPLCCEIDVISRESAQIERLMLGLRLNEGLPIDNLSLNPVAIQEVMQMGWVQQNADRLVLTPGGRHFCSEVALRLCQ